MEWNIYLTIVTATGLLFFASVVFALRWAARSGQFNRLDQQAGCIFDDEEPEGVQQDFFPGEADKARRRLDSRRDSR